MILVTIGEKIRVLRTAKGFSQKGLAMSVGLKQSKISIIENCKNKKDCDRETLDKICKALDISIDGLNNFASNNSIYQHSMSGLSKKDKELYDAFSSDEKSIEGLLQTMNILFKINEKFKRLLDDCEKKPQRY